MTKCADSLGFPFLRRELMANAPNLTPPAKLPDLIHATSVPPMVTDMETIQRTHSDFVEQWYRHQPDGSKAFFGLQHPPVDATDGDFRWLRDLEVSVMTLAYEEANVFGGGFAAPTAPLTDKGRELVMNLGGAKIVLDLSHAGHQTARQAMLMCSHISIAPDIFVSHAGCYEVFNHLRNLPDDVLRGVAECGGVIGLPLITWMIDGSHDGVEPFLMHLTHLIKVVGFDAICIASDAEYAPVQLPYTAAQYAAFEKMRATIDPRDNFKTRFPELPEAFAQPDRMEQVVKVLQHGGMLASNIDKVMHDNLANFADRAGITLL